MTIPIDSPFYGMTDEQSILYQLEQWAVGNALHNPIRNECCPDFSCCSDSKQMVPKEVRKQFYRAYKQRDHEIIMKMLSMMLSFAFPNANIIDGEKKDA